MCARAGLGGLVDAGRVDERGARATAAARGSLGTPAGRAEKTSARHRAADGVLVCVCDKADSLRVDRRREYHSRELCLQVELERKLFHVAGLLVPLTYWLLHHGCAWSKGACVRLCLVVTLVGGTFDALRAYVPSLGLNDWKHFLSSREPRR